MRPLLPALAALLALSPAAAAAPQTVTARASETAGAVGGNAISRNTVISGDGASVVFYGSSSNLVPGDTNGANDVFHKDTLSGLMRRASVATGGAEANSASQDPDVGQDGDVVVFESFATNLVQGDTNLRGDIFWHRMSSVVTLRVSLSGAGAQANGHSFFPACDDSGDLIAFESEATNLSGADTNGVKDIYLHDRLAGSTERISLTPAGVEPNGECRLPDVSPDGRWVGFQSDASNLVPGDANGVTDVFLKDRQTGALTRVSLGTGGLEGNGQSRYAALSFDGRFIAFSSESTNWVSGTIPFFATYVHERSTGVTVLVSKHSNGTPSNSACLQPSISRFGRWVAFAGSASNLVQGDTNGTSDVFLHDTLTAATQRLSTDSGGLEANGFSGLAALSDDGTRVAYESDATNLIAGDVNGQRDVFYGDRCGLPPSTYCTGKLNSAGCMPTMMAVGTPSASFPAAFDLIGQQVLNNKSGLLFYGLAPSATPFSGGIKCVQAPTQRTPLQNSSGNPPPDDCSGVLKYDFNQRIQSGLDPDLVPGTTVYAQYYYRDPPSSFNAGLTPAACFTIQP